MEKNKYKERYVETLKKIVLHLRQEDQEFRSKYNRKRKLLSFTTFDTIKIRILSSTDPRTQDPNFDSIDLIRW